MGGKKRHRPTRWDSLSHRARTVWWCSGRGRPGGAHERNCRRTFFGEYLRHKNTIMSRTRVMQSGIARKVTQKVPSCLPLSTLPRVFEVRASDEEPGCALSIREISSGMQTTTSA